MYNNVFCQSHNCSSLLYDYSRRLSNLSETNNNQSYQLDFTIEVIAKDKSRSHNDRINITKSKQLYHYQSNYMDIISDGISINYILKNQRLIVINKVSTTNDENDNLRLLAVLRDTLLKSCEITECKSIIGEAGESLIEIELLLPEDMNRQFKIERIIFQFSQADNNLFKTVYKGNSNCDFIYTTLKFNAFDFNIKEINPITVLSSEGTPIKPYSGFRIIDNR